MDDGQPEYHRGGIIQGPTGDDSIPVYTGRDEVYALPLPKFLPAPRLVPLNGLIRVAAKDGTLHECRIVAIESTDRGFTLQAEYYLGPVCCGGDPPVPDD